MSSDVPGQASSPKSNKPDLTLMRASDRLRPGFRFGKPEPTLITYILLLYLYLCSQGKLFQHFLHIYHLKVKNWNTICSTTAYKHTMGEKISRFREFTVTKINKEIILI